MNIFLIDEKKLSIEIKKNAFKYITTFIIVFFSCIIYLSLPSFYNYESFDKEIQNKISKDFKINIKKIKGIQYAFFPQPHFIIEQSSLYFNNNDEKPIADVKNLKVFLLLKNLNNLKKIEIKKIQLNKVNFNLNFEDIKNFHKHMNQNITKPIEIKNSNFFYKDIENNILSISSSKKFNYFINTKERQKKLNVVGNIFGNDYKFYWIRDYLNPNKTESYFKYKNPNIEINNTFNKNYENNEITGITKLSFLNYKIFSKYLFDKNQIIFLDSDDNKNLNDKFIFLGNIKLNPFFFNLNLNLNNIKLTDFTNIFFLNLHRLNNSSHKNFNGNLSVRIDNLDSKMFEDFQMRVSSFEEKIYVNNTTIKVKNIGSLNFLKLYTYEKDDKLFLKSEIEFDIENEKEFYQKFQIPKKNRIKLKKLFLEFENNLDDKKYYVSNLYLNNENFKEGSKYNIRQVNNYQQLILIIRESFKSFKKD
tara:strand:+ start:362 stop:1786 length:1425 start_codon:yes stop_codon:yes gene_type:complete